MIACVAAQAQIDLRGAGSSLTHAKGVITMRIAILAVLVCALVCALSAGGLWAAETKPLNDYVFTDQKARTLADFPDQTVAVWGMCKS